MPLRNALIAALLACTATVASPAAAQTPVATGVPRILFSNPIMLPTEDGPLAAEEGYVSVPENRAKPNSRPILVQYYRFKALKPSTQAPVVMLPGGPGDLLDRRDFEKKRYPHFTIRKTLRKILASRDVVVVNQRGNFWLLNNFGGFRAEQPSFPKGADPTQEDEIAAWKESLKSKFAEMTAAGVDLSGYDIRNSVEDIEDVRLALGYDKIILNGFSFGSQWGFSYLRTYPQHVLRAEFSGVEPLDYAYDSPDALWAVLKRISASAAASPIAGQLPPAGLEKAVLTILDRLQKQPAKVTIADPSTGKPTEVTIRREDFQSLLLRPWQGKTLRDAPAMWPKFVTEVYNGDYRYVALRKLGGLFPFNGNINFPLIDNSLGITGARDRKLLSEKGRDVIGDPNLFYRRWADITPTKPVDDDYRALAPIDVPVLLIQGDLDWSTPLDNALEQGRYLNNGAVVTVQNGTHIVGYEVTDYNPELDALSLGFLDLESQPDPNAKAFLAKMPKTVTLPLEFVAPNSAPLYEQVTSAK